MEILGFDTSEINKFLDQIDNVFYSVYNTFNCLPKPDQMEFDNVGVNGLLYWYKGVQKLEDKIDQEAKRNNK